MIQARKKRWLELAHVYDKKYEDVPIKRFDDAIEVLHETPVCTNRAIQRIVTDFDTRYTDLEASITRLEDKFGELVISVDSKFDSWKLEAFDKITNTDYRNYHYFDTLVQEVIKNVNEIDTLKSEVDNKTSTIENLIKENMKLKAELEEAYKQRDVEILQKMRCETDLKRVKSSIQALIHPLNHETRITSL